jgi:hypothetical protein
MARNFNWIFFSFAVSLNGFGRFLWQWPIELDNRVRTNIVHLLKSVCGVEQTSGEREKIKHNYYDVFYSFLYRTWVNGLSTNSVFFCCCRCCCCCCCLVFINIIIFTRERFCPMGELKAVQNNCRFYLSFTKR